MGQRYVIPAWAGYFDPFYGSALCHLYVVGQPHVGSTLCQVDTFSLNLMVKARNLYKSEAKVFILDKPFQPSLMFVGEARSIP